MALVFLVAIEVSCRLRFPEEAPIRFMQDVRVLVGGGEDAMAGSLIPDRELFWRFAHNIEVEEMDGRYGGVISNGQGLREDHEIPLQKPEDELRVLFLGSSPTYGTGVLLRDCFVERVEERLEEMWPGQAIECINTGVPGYSLFQGVRYFETQGRNFQPDLVVVQFGASGLQIWDDKGDIQHWEQNLAQTPPGMLRHSRFMRLLWKRQGSKTEGRKRPRLLPQEFRATLTKLTVMSREDGFDLMLVAWPSRTHVNRKTGARRTPLHEILLDFADRRGYAKVDLLATMTNLASEITIREVYLDQWHATVAGNDAVSERLARAIREWRER